MKWKIAILCAVVAVGGANAARAQEVLAGLDLLETVADQTHEDLSNLSAFCPGAQVVGNPIIPLRGIPLQTLLQCPNSNLGNTDTAIQRLASTFGLDSGPRSVPIEIVALHLQSVQPFVVNNNGTLERWTLDVSVGPGNPQTIGSMLIQKTSTAGGVFSSNLIVKPHLTFTRVTACPAQVICELDGPPIQFGANSAPWSYTRPPVTPVLLVPGCTTNFFPGVIPGSQIVGGNEIQAFNEAALLAMHSPKPPPPPKLFQDNWQMAVHFDFHLKNISNTMVINDFRIKNARYIPMAPVGARADSTIIIKSTSICDPTPFCPLQQPDRWTRVNWDSTSLGYKKEAFWLFPPVPPGAQAPPMDIVFSVPCGALPGIGAWYDVDYECTFNCVVVDSGTFRFNCPPAPPCNTPVGCDTTLVQPPVGVPGDLSGSGKLILEQNAPNPFLANTAIRFSLQRQEDVVLRIYDARGRMVRTLLNERRAAGDQAVSWDARDDGGHTLPAGAYFYEIQLAGARQAKKMIMVK